MEYKVSTIAKMTGVTAKTLRYYHRIGLLHPARITEKGYRVYGDKELLRLQQILFYRELDFPLPEINSLLEQNSNLLERLEQQYLLMTRRRMKLGALINNLENTIRGERLDDERPAQSLFNGFTEDEWREMIEEQKRNVPDTDILALAGVDAV